MGHTYESGRCAFTFDRRAAFGADDAIWWPDLRLFNLNSNLWLSISESDAFFSGLQSHSFNFKELSFTYKTISSAIIDREVAREFCKIPLTSDLRINPFRYRNPSFWSMLRWLQRVTTSRVHQPRIIAMRHFNCSARASTRTVMREMVIPCLTQSLSYSL